MDRLTKIGAWVNAERLVDKKVKKLKKTIDKQVRV